MSDDWQELTKEEYAEELGKCRKRAKRLGGRIAGLKAENEQLRDRLDFVCRHIEDIAQDGVVPTAVRNIMENDVRLRPEEQP